MKKQFFRVKQLADQTFLRADKTEVLNYEELQIADQKIEYLRSALSAVNKKIPALSQGNESDKRRRKTLEHNLGQLFVEHSFMKKGETEKPEEECVLFQSVLRECGQVEECLANEYFDHEVKVEEMIGNPLQDLIDNELPNIAKLKRNLSKYILDKDSASNRYHATKKEALRDDMEEADSKVEQSRDALATEMFGFLSRENELASYFLQLLKIQRGYHDMALKHLEGLIPILEKKIGDSPIKRVFGCPLEEHLRVTKKRIAFPLEICVENLTRQGLIEEGLFRIAGSVSRVKRLKCSIDANCLTQLIPEYRDVHVLASTLKMYLRELPEPLLTYRLHDEWLNAMEINTKNDKLKVVEFILSKLPRENRDNLRYLMRFFKKLSEHRENKMTSSNIAIVIAPNLLWSQKEHGTNMNMNNCGLINQLVEFFIHNADDLFPPDETFFSINLPRALIWEDEFERPPSPLSLSQSKLQEIENFRVSVESLTDSPKPNSRKKKAPGPPQTCKTDQDLTDKPMSASYPSGSSTLTRPPKSVKASIATSTDDLLPAHKPTSPVSGKHDKVSSAIVSTETIVTAQSPECDKSFKTTVTHQVHTGDVGGGSTGGISRPVAAPRTITLSRNSSMKDGVGEVQMRKPEVAHKPEIPARPASLQKRSSIDSHLSDPSVHKTQCSVYSVANKQQASLVHLMGKEKHQPGHDNLIAEKEKFLGHPPHSHNLENKAGDVNSNPSRIRVVKPSLPPKGGITTKSTEKLDGSLDCEKLNGNPKPSHVRTRSDGNLMDLGDDNNPISFMNVPPSPRSLNKPTEPPPPPPNIATRGSDGNSTDL